MIFGTNDIEKVALNLTFRRPHSLEKFPPEDGSQYSVWKRLKIVRDGWRWVLTSAISSEGLFTQPALRCIGAESIT